MFCFGPLSVPYRRGKSSRPWVQPGSGTTSEKIRLRERSRSHHIYPYTPSSSLFLPPRRDGGVLGGNGAWKEYLVVLSPASASTSHAVFSCVKQKRLQRKVIGKYDFSASFLEPSLPRGGSSTKGGPLAQSSTSPAWTKTGSNTKQWNKASAYHVHPYFSDNLKYAC
jgi:hypothetical protein